MTWLWQAPNWPRLTVDGAALAQPLAAARLAQGRLLGRAEALGESGVLPAEQIVWTGEALATAAIEGEALDPVAVRSSVARRLGLAAPSVAVPRSVDGLLDVMQDAAQSWPTPLDKGRLCQWHAALFPTGRSGLRTIVVGAFRSGAEPMQIVSGPQGREVVRFEAVPGAAVNAEMHAFLAWFDASRSDAGLDGLVRAALAHLWFETIHPFEDGNGRLGRALVDLAVAQDVRAPWRMHGLSRRLLKEREAYYATLDAAQRGDTDVTAWVDWFLRTFEAACRDGLQVVDEAIERGQYWARLRDVAVSDAQRKVLNRMLEAGRGRFEGGMTPRKFIALTGLSRATATRELGELADAGLLRRVGAGRSTRYELPMPGWQWQGPPRPGA